MTGISIREFAKREGCAPSLVVKAITKGRLAKLPDGKLDPDLVGTGWRETNRRSAAAVAPAPAPSTDAGGQGDQGDVPAPLISDTMTHAEAERVKEIYLARQRKLEFDRDSKLVAPTALMVEEVAKRLAAIRAKLMGLGATITPRLAPKSSKAAAEIQAEIDKVVRKVLEELSSGSAAAD